MNSILPADVGYLPRGTFSVTPHNTDLIAVAAGKVAQSVTTGGVTTPSYVQPLGFMVSVTGDVVGEGKGGESFCFPGCLPGVQYLVLVTKVFSSTAVSGKTTTAQGIIAFF